MNALEMVEWRKDQKKKKCKMARPNGKPVVRTRMICNINIKDGKVEKYKCRFVFKGSVRSRGCTKYLPTPATA